MHFGFSFVRTFGEERNWKGMNRSTTEISEHDWRSVLNARDVCEE